jgi:hypothetical protein
VDNLVAEVDGWKAWCLMFGMKITRLCPCVSTGNRNTSCVCCSYVACVFWHCMDRRCAACGGGQSTDVECARRRLVLMAD